MVALCCCGSVAGVGARGELMSHPESDPQRRLHMNRAAWDAYHPAWMEMILRERPDYHSFFRSGGVDLDEAELDLVGDIRGLHVLQLSCGCDAHQAFSLANLGAVVTACDISPVAISIARANLAKIGCDVTFLIEDSQSLATLGDRRFDLVFAQYNLCYYEDIRSGCRNWHRVLRAGGRLLLREFHPVTACLRQQPDSEALEVERGYDDRKPEYYCFDGTPIAQKFGGWQSDLQAVEFFHSVSDIVNAVVDAGFLLDRMVETVATKAGRSKLERLPQELFVLAHRQS